MDTRTPDIGFLPTTVKEMKGLGWAQADVILVSGDTYIDSPHIGVSMVGRVLVRAGFRVGVIAQPDVHSAADITRLGEPRLFWGVSAGCMDSMVANYTALGKPRRSDDLTPGGRNTRRPDRACIAYTNLIRRHFKNTAPIVLGGVEASLRRISHYDGWSDKVRRSVLFDAKADLLVYGMAEQSIVELAEALRDGRDIRGIRGLCYISKTLPEPIPAFGEADVVLPDHPTVSRDTQAFTSMFLMFYANNNAHRGQRLLQQQDTRYLVHNPPAAPLSVQELDAVYELPYTRAVHPYYAAHGKTAALETIRFSLTTHRGCYGECRFCAIAVHQGTQVISRSHDSLLREAASFVRHPEFRGVISDVGGPTANMYAIECPRKQRKGPCRDKSCLFPSPCPSLPLNHSAQIDLLRSLARVPGVRKVFVGSGLRYDMVAGDQAHGRRYLAQVLSQNTSGQFKIAPEHCQAHVLALMGKPGRQDLQRFLDMVQGVRGEHRLKVFVTYYLMAAHPGCTLADMRALRDFARQKLGMLPEQVQIFTPTPSTLSTLMYHTGCDPFSGREIFVEKTVSGKMGQKKALAPKG
ncbi:MAG: YgiQ family radical SAM protein [Desulfosarcinaceae bacterium]